MGAYLLYKHLCMKVVTLILGIILVIMTIIAQNPRCNGSYYTINKTPR